MRNLGRPDPRLPSLRRRLLAPLLVALVGLLLTIGAHHLIRGQETRRLQAEFDASAWHRARDIEFALRVQTVALESVSDFLALGGTMGQGEFERFVRPIVDELPGVDAIAWVPRDTLAATGTAGRFVVRWVVPREHASLTPGQDLTADPSLQPVLESALLQGEPEATERRSSWPMGVGRLGRLVVIPVRQTPPTSPRDRAARTSSVADHTPGVVAAAVSVATVVREALGAPGVFDATTALWDLDAREGDRLVVVHQPRDTAQPELWDGDGEPPVHRGIRPRRTEITAYGRRFVVITAPTPAIVAERSVARVTTLAGGISTSILLFLILFILSGRQARLQLAVAERTAALQVSEARYRGIVEDQTELICRFTPDCVITYANHSYAEYRGKTPGQMIGVNWLEFLPEPSRGPALESIRALSAEHPTRSIEHQVRSGDGTTRWQHWVDRALPDETGRIVEIQSVGRDTTDRHLAEEALIREKALLRSLIDSIPDLIFFKDAHSVYLGCNRAFAEYAGLREEELMGTTDLDLFPRDVAESYRENDRVMMESGRARHNEEWIRYPDGRMVLLDTLKTPFYGPGGSVLGLIGISRDITRAREAEDQAQEAHRRLMTVREEERRRVAEELHEVVCQDIAALRLSLQTMAVAPSAAPAERLRRAAAACQETIGTIRQICYALYPPQLGPMGLRAALLALPRPIEDAAAGGTLDIDIDPGLPRFDPALEVALFRVAQEAVSNALRHAAATRVQLRIETGHGIVRLTIEDDGNGLDPDAPPSGLGLRIMRERMIAVGGTLDIVSRPGRTRIVATAPFPGASGAPVTESGDEARPA